MNAENLYNALVGNAGKLAAQSTLDVNDIRQELYLMCMEVAEGRSAYSSMVGGVHKYIMGRLWGLIRRWVPMQSLDELMGQDIEGENSAIEHLPGHSRSSALHVPSAEDVLIHRHEMLEQDVIDVEERFKLKKSLQNQTTMVILLQRGHWSTREAAKYCGISRNAIEKRLSATKCQKGMAKDHC